MYFEHINSEYVTKLEIWTRINLQFLKFRIHYEVRIEILQLVTIIIGIQNTSIIAHIY